MLNALLIYVLGIFSGFALAIVIGHRIQTKRVTDMRQALLRHDADLKRQFEPDPGFEYNPYPHPHLRAGWDRTPTPPQE